MGFHSASESSHLSWNPCVQLLTDSIGQLLSPISAFSGKKKIRSFHLASHWTCLSFLHLVHAFCIPTPEPQWWWVFLFYPIGKTVISCVQKLTGSKEHHPQSIRLLLWISTTFCYLVLPFFFFKWYCLYFRSGCLCQFIFKYNMVTFCAI